MRPKLFPGLAAFPSADRLSPLDTFLDLLTAKGAKYSTIFLLNIIYYIVFRILLKYNLYFLASLTELDFGLLIEATVTSTEDFL